MDSIDAEIGDLDMQLERLRKESARLSRSFPQTMHSTPRPSHVGASRDSGMASGQSDGWEETDYRGVYSREEHTKSGARPKVRFSASTHEEAEVTAIEQELADTPDFVTTRRGRPRLLPNPPKQSTSPSNTGHNAQGSADSHRRPDIKPATYDGTSSWLDYHVHFESCASINNWSDVEKGLYLAVSLRKQAQMILGDLPVGQRQHYASLTNALEARFANPNQTELFRVQFREKRQKAGESLPELGQAIRRLARLAYPSAPEDVRETLAKEQFIDALVVSDMRLRIKQSRPQTLDDAIRLAVELEAFIRAEPKGHMRATTETTEQEAQKITTQAQSKTANANDNLDVKKLLEAMKSKLDKVQQEMTEMKLSQTQ